MTGRARKFGVIFFSVVFWLVSFLWMGLLALSIVILLPFVPYKRSYKWLASPGMATCVRMTGSKISVMFDPAFDPDRRSVFCQNHVNVLDPHVAAAAIPHAFSGVMNGWHFYVPVYGWLMRLSKGIPVHRANAFAILQSMTEAAKNRKAEGFSVLVFPEAHRTVDGRVQKFQKGVFLMARDAGYPVVPLAVRGSHAVNQKNSFLFRPGNISVYVGPQMETKGLANDEIEVLAEKVQGIVEDFVERNVISKVSKEGVAV